MNYMTFVPYINLSVGEGGRNKPKDVIVIQALLNRSLPSQHKKLVLDGRYGKNTGNAIRVFQSIVMKVARPDARVDVGGKTIQVLRTKCGQFSYSGFQSEAEALKNVDVSSKAKVYFKENVSTDKRNELSQYTMGFCSYLARIFNTEIKISSARRTPKEQAIVMIDNVIGSGFKSSFKLYGSNGDTILTDLGREIGGDEFSKNKIKVDKPKIDTEKSRLITYLQDQILSMQNRGKLVSLHCVSKAQYKMCNVIDISLAPIESSRIFYMNNLFKDLSRNGFLKKYFFEAKQNCFHLEIIQSRNIIELAVFLTHNFYSRSIASNVH